MMEEIAKLSPRLKARIAGVFYLATISMGAFAAFNPGGLVVSGNAAITATNILTHELLFRSAFAANLIATSCYIVVTLLFYDLFKPVNRSISLLAAFFSLMGCAMGAVSSLFYIAPLTVLAGAPGLSVFRLEQLQGLAFMFLRLSAQANNIGLVFFGFYCLLIGHLTFRSTFLPRALGVLMACAGLAWLTFLVPSIANLLNPFNVAAGVLGEGSLTLWLLVTGLDVHRWKEQVRRAGNCGILDSN